MRLRRSKNYKEVLMKNLFKLLGNVALVAMIGFTIASCSTNNANSTNSTNSIMTDEEQREWITALDPPPKSLIQRGMATQEMQTPGLTAAHPAIRIDTKATIKNLRTRKEVVVTITERIAPSGTRVIDVSPETARALDLGSTGDPVIIIAANFFK